MSHVVVHEDWVPPAVAWIRDRIERAVTRRGRATVALCGGSTPAPLYNALGGDVDWSRVELVFGDERCVPWDHADSNYRLVKEALLFHVKGDPPTVCRLVGEGPDPDASARSYEQRLPERLDLALQGIGEDGHTAALFPGHPTLAERTRRVVHVSGAPKPPADRLTVTLPVLEAARHTVVLARGAGKAQALARALQGAPDLDACPAQVCRGGAWFLDPAAASALDPETIA